MMYLESHNEDSCGLQSTKSSCRPAVTRETSMSLFPMKRQTMNFQWNLGILLLLPLATLQLSTRDLPSYIGAVAEYSPVLSNDDGKTAADINAENYVKFIKKAAEYGADILVFPESSLSISTSENKSVARIESKSYIPDPRDKIAPCDDDENIYKSSLKIVSRAAREYRIYVVINHGEKLDCEGSADCPADGFLTYNTNVVFDRDGRVIARYRKFNLYGEPGTNITAQPEIATFDTDFGVTFGTFICFDILFSTPTLNYTRDLNLTDVIFTSHWFSELPYLYSVQAQAAWAYANDANLLAAGYSYQETASGGSGIYVGQNGYVKVISEEKNSNILVVGEIPKVVKGKRSLNINPKKLQIYKFSKSEISTTELVGNGTYLHKTENLTIYTTELIDLKQSSYNKTLCDRNFCCEFKLKIAHDKSLIKADTGYYRYRLSVFNGTRSFTVRAGGVKICGIIPCTDDTLDSCGHTFQSGQTVVTPTTFESIDIVTQNIINQNVFFMPTSISKNMMPLNATDFFFKSIDLNETSSYHLRLTKPRSDLLTFAVWGRDFANEAPESSSANLASSSLLIVIAFTCLLVQANSEL